MGNDKKILNVKEIHSKKSKESGMVAGFKSNDPDKVIANYSFYNLSDNEKKLLAKGLNFVVPPRKLNYADYLAPYGLLFRDVKNLSVEDNILERIKVDLKKICFASLDRYKFEDKINLTKEEMQVLRDLSSREDIIIQKQDKGNSVVILNKVITLKEWRILSDIEKFKKFNVKLGKELNCLLQHEDKLVNFLKRVKKSLGEEVYKNLYPQGSQPGVLYGLSKIHKPLVNNIPKLRPNLSALNTGTYKWAKFFVPFLQDITSNEYTLKDSFEFAKVIRQQYSDLYMASLDVDSLFTNVPLDETIGICSQGLFESDSTVYGLNKKEITEMLSLTTKATIILFDMEFYSQIDGLAMGSPLGATLTNVFVCHHEKKWLNNCPNSFKPVFYKRYVDDIFILFKKSEHVQFLVNYMNSKHKNISFSYEAEKDGVMPFLDVNIFREKGKFVTNVYRKETFTGVCTNVSNFIPLEYKFGLAYTL